MVLAAALAFASAAHAGLEREIVGSEQDHSLAGATTAVSCEDSFNNAFTLQPQTLREQSLHEFDARSVDVRIANLGGVVVRGSESSHVRMVVCRFAAADTVAGAATALDAIRVTSQGGVVRATGPAINEQQTWWVNLTLFVPRRTPVTLRTEQGGIAIRDMHAPVDAFSVSGGISIARSSGRHIVRTESGGITLDRVRGPVDARSKDGSIAYKFMSNEKPSLEANIAQSGQILCVLERCQDALATQPRKSLRLAGNSPRVRLSTGSGSIHISSVKS